MEASTTISKVHTGHAPHPNYFAIFIWLVILTAIEVTIPEVVQIKSAGLNTDLPTVVSVEALPAVDGYSAEQVENAWKNLKPAERSAAMGWGAKIAVLAALAIIKAGLVGAFFMHLKFDGWKLNLIMAVPTVLFLIIILLLFPDIGIDWPSLY